MQNQSNLDIAHSFATNDPNNKHSYLKLKKFKIKSIEKEEIAKYIVGNIEELKVINLSFNLIDEIPVSFIEYLRHITRLQLDNNYIFKIPSEICRLEKLESISLSNNILSFIPSSMSKLQNLNALYLNNNKLSALPIELSTLKEMRKLYLHNTRLENVPCIFHHFNHLKEVSLQWFAYIDPPLKRLVKSDGMGHEIISKLKYLSYESMQNRKPYFTFEEFAAFFSKYPIKIDQKNSNGEYLLNQACSYADSVFAKTLLTKGAGPNNPDQNDLTPLAIAIRDDQFKISKMLINYGAKVNLQLKVCGNHLNIAAMKMSASIVRYLVKNGADVNLRDSEGNAPLHLVLSIFDKNPDGAAEVCEILLRNGAKPNMKNNDRWAPIHLAARRGQLSAINWILKYNQRAQKALNLGVTEQFKININGGDLGWTALHLASNSGHFEIVQALSEADVKVFKRTQQNYTPRQVFTGNLVTYKFLIKEEVNWAKRNLILKGFNLTTLLSETRTFAINDFFESKEPLLSRVRQNPQGYQITISNSKESNILHSKAPQGFDTKGIRLTSENKMTEIHNSGDDTISYHSSDMVSNDDLDSSIDSTLSNRFSNTNNYVFNDKTPSVNISLGTLEYTGKGEAGLKGPKISKSTKSSSKKTDFKSQLTEYYRNESSYKGNSIISRVEKKGLLVQRRKALDPGLTLYERLYALSQLFTYNDDELMMLYMMNILEEAMKSKNKDDKTFDLFVMEAIRVLTARIKLIKSQHMELIGKFLGFVFNRKVNECLKSEARNLMVLYILQNKS